MTIPIIGAPQPIRQLPPLHIEGGALGDQVFLQFAPCALLSIEDMERIVEGLQAAIANAKAHRAAVQAAMQGNGASLSAESGK